MSEKTERVPQERNISIISNPPPRTRVLIAEDSTVYRHLIEVALGDTHELTFVDNAEAAWQVLQAPESPRLLILDWMLPDAEGVDLCARLRQGSSQQYCYVVLLTARSSEEDLLTAMAAGADDFVRKPFSAAELLARVKAGSRILALQEQLVNAAMYDALTGILNRAAIFSALQKELNRCRREARPLGVILVDVDNFKSINDTYGHGVGDQVLSQVAISMGKFVRPYDLVGRYGGEEFLICLPGAGFDVARRRAEQVREAIENSEVSTVRGAVRVTISMGMTITSDGDAFPVEKLLRAADSALYRAKALGKNRLEVG